MHGCAFFMSKLTVNSRVRTALSLPHNRCRPSPERDSPSANIRPSGLCFEGAYSQWILTTGMLPMSVGSDCFSRLILCYAFGH
jgi:hypothetical protein